MKRLFARSPRRGFTLMEVLVALVLISAVVTAAFSFFWSLGAARDRLSAASGRSLACASLHSLLQEAIQSSEVGGGGASFSGDARTLTIPCRVVRVGGAPGRAPFVRLLRLQFDAGARMLMASWDGGVAAPIVTDVGAVAFKAYDGRQWSEEFNAASQGRLPAAIELSLWWQTPAAAGEDDTQAQSQPADVLITLRVPDADGDAEGTDGAGTAQPVAAGEVTP
ncbi:MAG: prepilin-type N-terminal cleavage/methylation domain-containing protein [Planctomycetota bacterium]|nr:prepilin-type N-terminal cleavage/methylation domain-containing protein [Planctomycetota bacterium]